MFDRTVIDVSGERVFVEANAEAAQAKLAELVAEGRDALIASRADAQTADDLRVTRDALRRANNLLTASEKECALVHNELQEARDQVVATGNALREAREANTLANEQAAQVAAQLDEAKAMVADRDSRIAELTAQLEAARTPVEPPQPAEQPSEEKPAEEPAA